MIVYHLVSEPDLISFNDRCAQASLDGYAPQGGVSVVVFEDSCRGNTEQRFLYSQAFVKPAPKTLTD